MAAILHSTNGAENDGVLLGIVAIPLLELADSKQIAAIAASSSMLSAVDPAAELSTHRVAGDGMGEPRRPLKDQPSLIGSVRCEC
jgi:hypothetical protein